MAFDDNKRELSLGELENANTDRSVNPATMVRGMMGKNGSNWVFISADSNGNLVTNSTATVTTAPLSASSSTISAIQGDAGSLHVSAINQDANFMHVSGFSPDAGLFRISSIGGSLSLSADASGNRVSAIQSDAGLLHTSAFVDSGSISAKSGDSGQMHVSSLGAYLGGNKLSAYGSLAHVIAGIDTNGIIRPIETDNTGNIAITSPDAGIVLISAKSGDAGLFHVSSTQSDAGLLHISAFVDSGSVSARSGDGNQFHVSAVQGDAGLLHISSIVGDANNQHVSAVQGDAGLMHVSAYLGVDTTGALTTFQTLSVSASQSVKGSAGVLYGYYLFNTDTKPNYVKFFNVSAAANIGTDTPLFTICLPASAAANVEFPHGIKGFTNGINITATSGRPLDNTALPAASSVGAVLFYN